VRYKLGKYKRLDGKVVTAYNNEPVPLATISLHREGDNDLTFVGSVAADENGRFCFKNLPAGKYVLKVGSNGFKRFDIYLEVAPNDRESSAKKLTVELNVGT
jgi:hypothetical protein